MSRERMLDNQYWHDRGILRVQMGEKTALEMVKDLEPVYNEAIKQLQKEIDAFYGKHAAQKQMELSDIYRRLNQAELKSIMDDINKYYDAVRRYGGDPRYETYLRHLSARAHLSRLEGLQVQMRNHVEILYTKIHNDFTKNLKTVYQEAYYRTIFDTQQGIGFGLQFQSLNTAIVEAAIRQKWHEKNYSDRIWTNKQLLINELNTTFLQGVALGRNPNLIGRQMAKNMDTAYNRGVRLARTEFNHISNEATMDSYVKYGVVEEYRYLATLDHRTSEICQELDNNVFDIKDAEVGVNYPPMHPNCRSTTTANFPKDEVDALFEEGTRIARDPITGQNYYVPADMSYKEWKESLTEEQGRAYMSLRKQNQNRSNDRIQFDSYKSFIRDAKQEHGAIVSDLFEGFPTKFADFQAMKYMETEKWEIFKDNRKIL